MVKCNTIESVKKLEDEGKTAVLVGNQDHIIGIIALMDGLRDSSPGTIHALKEMGIKTAMLTGDNHGTAKAVSLSIGIEQYYLNFYRRIRSKLSRNYQNSMNIWPW